MGAPLVSMVLLIQTGFICGTEKVTPIIGMKGGAVHLPATVPAEFSTRDVFWRHLSPTDHLVASFSRGSIDTNYQSRFYGRVRLLHNFTLVILNLELKDTGMFTCQMVDNNGHMRLHRFHLTVYEVVAVPEVQVYTSRGTVDCSMILACNTSMGSNVTYSWVTDTGQGLPLNRTHTLHHDSRLLRVLLTPSDQNVSFTCIVTNMVSQEKTAVAPWTHCFGQQGSEAGVSSRKVFLLIGIFLAVTFILMLFLVFLLTRNSNLVEAEVFGVSCEFQGDQETIYWVCWPPDSPTMANVRREKGPVFQVSNLVLREDKSPPEVPIIVPFTPEPSVRVFDGIGRDNDD